jgi:hypothetical protein
MTVDQCRDYALPRTPIKETERRAEAFEARFGEGATELDALEALHPGELRRILVQEIERYYDDTLDDRASEAADEFQDRLDLLRRGAIERHRVQRDAAASRYRALIEQCNAEIAEVANRYSTQIEDAARLFNSEQRAIANDLVAITPEYTTSVEPYDGDDDPDPLFDSTRDYVEQINRFKQHQGKRTERKRRERFEPKIVRLRNE